MASRKRRLAALTAKLKVWNPTAPDRVEEAEVLVNPQILYSWVSRSRLERLGLKPNRQVRVRTKDGREICRDMVAVMLAVAGKTGATMAVAAEPGETEVIGEHTLIGFGLVVDSVTGELVPQTEPVLALVAGKAGSSRAEARSE